MSSLFEFLAMDGHGPFVWSAYAITFVVLALNFLQPWLSRRRLINIEARRRRRERV